MLGNALEVEDLSVEVGGAAVLHHLSFAVPRGSALAVIGPNGAGKTVLFRALIGALPSRGVVRWAPGTRIGYVPQKLDIDRDLPLTGTNFLRSKAAVTGAGREDVRRALAEVNLPQRIAERPIGALSGGQFQRLLLAFALVGRPNALLFDEPTAGVDEPGEERLYEMIRRVQGLEHLTLLLISHELSLVQRFADNVLCLSGEAPWFGPPDEVLTPERIERAYGTPLRYHHHKT
ncbi:MAG TPA: metal ABC transporter ATP-binding protein [Anaeromyxobacter sp.]|nr:metal ABC transporter ATP-binding protein [Anaeromyxobacter sp.]